MIAVSKGLACKGHQVLIGCRKNSKIEANARDKGIPTFPFSVLFDFDVIAFLRALVILRKEKFDVVVCVQNRDVKIVGLAARVLGKPKVILRQGLTNLKPTLIHKKWVIGSIQGIVANANSIRDQYLSYGWFNLDFIKLIHNGIDEADIPSEPLALRPSVGEEATPVSILASGRLVPEKGYALLVEVARMAKERNRNWRFVIAGTGKSKDSLLGLINYYKLNETITLAGFCSDLTPFLKEAELFVHPSFHEGMSNSVMEAMSYGLACVVTRVDGAGELIQDGVNGLLVEPGSAEALFDRIDWLLANPASMMAIREQARQTIREKFKLSYTVNELEQFLASKI